MLLIAGSLAGCASDTKKLNERITLWRKDKIPYGTFYAYENLQSVFPNATVVVNKRSPDAYKSPVPDSKTYDESYANGPKHSYIIIGGQVSPDVNEINALLNLAGEGSQVFISSLFISSNFLDTMGLNTAHYSGYLNREDSLTVSVDNPVTGTPYSFSYPGMALDNYFNEMDSSITTILGRNKDGKANFVKFSYDGGGAVYLHLAPAALTNFFLLHKDNKAYYDNVLSYLPNKTEVVHWDDYFRYHSDGEGGRRGFSALSWLLKQPGFAAAWWLLLLLLLIIYLFESKRKQRIIPAIAPLRNASLDFVKTIGRLYFQRKDNKNLAHKMMAHFLDHVRNKYNIRTSAMDEDFAKRLAYKSGYDIEAVQKLVLQLHMSQDEPELSDHSLLQLNQQLEHFYKYG